MNREAIRALVDDDGYIHLISLEEAEKRVRPLRIELLDPAPHAKLPRWKIVGATGPVITERHLAEFADRECVGDILTIFEPLTELQFNLVMEEIRARDRAKVRKTDRISQATLPSSATREATLT
ncbi:MAG: hypothetical protein JWN50_705 [Parcubacteria group bacterium]|nr:hypothetical protein [Parcubacteria group bacterium]